ncbi:MAG: hypothetical protein J0H74_06890 [Chitinophagaceae bacterium]|nr:hypothetical protein [Chitinophagaceae bacterium]
MTRYSLVLNKKGTILSFKVVDADPERFPVKDMTGLHFSWLIGENCKKDLRYILQEISRTRQTRSFRTFFSPRGNLAGPVVEWTIEPKPGNIFSTARFVLIGKDPE